MTHDVIYRSLDKQFVISAVTHYCSPGIVHSTNRVSKCIFVFVNVQSTRCKYRFEQLTYYFRMRRRWYVACEHMQKLLSMNGSSIARRIFHFKSQKCLSHKHLINMEYLKEEKKKKQKNTRIIWIQNVHFFFSVFFFYFQVSVFARAFPYTLYDSNHMNGTTIQKQKIDNHMWKFS